MSQPAIRIHAATEVEERLEHVPTPRGLLYSWTARPLIARSCVLVCSSVFGDFVANYHRERLLGRSLLSRGHGVIRFHYAGEGNSQGERRDMTFSSMCDDAQAILDYAASLGFSEFAVLGTRVGALVAAATVASLPSVPLVLWEPVMEPLHFVRDAQRASRISQVAQERTGRSTDWRQELRQTGMLDLLGYDVYSPFVDSLDDIDLLSLLGSLPRKMLIARFRGKAGTKDRLSDTLADRGFTVESENFDLLESWFLHSELVVESRDLITATTAWLTKVFGE